MVGVMAQEGAPSAALPVAPWRGRNVTAFEDVSHTGSADTVSQLLEFALYLAVTPLAIFSG
jgi:hypothetical protein